jgi:ELWxxDGT repeat protein
MPRPLHKRRSLLLEPLESRRVMTVFANPPRNFVSVGETVYFLANYSNPPEDRARQAELWKTDGTPDGTEFVHMVREGLRYNDDFEQYTRLPNELVNYNGTLYFNSVDSTHGFELWKSDGTTDGTRLVKDIYPGSSGSRPLSFTNVNGTLYFSADGSYFSGRELWKSNGSAQGTVMVEDLGEYSPGYGYFGSYPSHLTNLRGILYFDTSTGHWKVDPADGEVVSVNFPAPEVDAGYGLFYLKRGSTISLGITDGEQSSQTLKAFQTVDHLTNVSGIVYFSAKDGSGTGLWRSDGTGGGTIRLGPADIKPESLVNVAGELYFSATDAAGGRELWKSDGTQAGTVQVTDLRSGPASSYVQHLTNFGGTLYFAATDGGTGLELWQSNGTAATTVQVSDLKPGPDSSYPRELMVLQGRTLFFITNDGNDVQPHLLYHNGNAPPHLDVSQTVHLGQMEEDPADVPSASVGALVDTEQSDADGTGLKGVAICGAETTGGQWQYSLNSGADWLSLGAPSETGARLLAADGATRLRFVPNPDFAGVARISYRAWDRTEGTAGALFDTTAETGSPFSFSSQLGTGQVRIFENNDAPSLDTSLQPVLTAVREDARFPRGDLVSSLLAGAVTDPDSSAQRGIAVTVASDFHGKWQFSLNDGDTWQAMGGPSESAARLLPAYARVRFLPKPDFHGDVKIHYRAWDQTSGISGGLLDAANNKGDGKTLSTGNESVPLTVTPVNDPPKLILSGSLGYVHDQRAITLAPSAVVADIDSPNFYKGRLRVRITDGASTSNRLAIGAGFTLDANNNVLQGTTIIGKRVANGFGTNELIITFNSKATPAVVQQLLRVITFKTVGGAAGQRKVLFTVSDGDGGLSAEASKTVNVS